jgi:hypothetical protein
MDAWRGLWFCRLQHDLTVFTGFVGLLWVLWRFELETTRQCVIRVVHGRKSRKLLSDYASCGGTNNGVITVHSRSLYDCGIRPACPTALHPRLQRSKAPKQNSMASRHISPYFNTSASWRLQASSSAANNISYQHRWHSNVTWLCLNKAMASA